MKSQNKQKTPSFSPVERLVNNLAATAGLPGAQLEDRDPSFGQNWEEERAVDPKTAQRSLSPDTPRAPESVQNKCLLTVSRTCKE